MVFLKNQVSYWLKTLEANRPCAKKNSFLTVYKSCGSKRLGVKNPVVYKDREETIWE